MDKYNKLKEAFANLSKFFTENESELKFQSIKIKDSDSLLEFPALEKDAEVKISTGTGSEVAPDGEYQLVDGSVITVKDGKIAEVKSESDDAPVEGDKPEELAEEKPVEEPVKEDNKVAELEERIKSLEDLIKSITDKLPTEESLSKFKDEFNSVIEDLDKKIEMLSKIPTQLSRDNRVEVKESELDKYKRIAELFSK